MKALLFSFFALSLTTVAMADVPEIRAKEVTCAELQQNIANYKEVTVLYRPFLFMNRLTVNSEIECGASADKKQAFFKTKDEKSCAAGFFCEERPVVIIHSDPYPHGPISHPHPGPIHHPGPISHPHPTPHAPRGDHYNPHPGGSHAPHAPRGDHYNPRPNRCHGRSC